MVAAIAEAVVGPKPGMLIRRRAVSSFCAIFAIVRSSRAIAWSRFRNCTTSGASASHSNGIVSSQASISSASSRAYRSPCGAITPFDPVLPGRVLRLPELRAAMAALDDGRRFCDDPVEAEEVEGDEAGLRAAGLGAQRPEIAASVRSKRDRLAVDQRVFGGQLADRLRDLRQPV